MPSESLVEKFYKEERFHAVSEIVTEERWLKLLKSLYVKHAFDAFGNAYRKYYSLQVDLIKDLKLKYKEKYG